jgi:hypothetical protein
VTSQDQEDRHAHVEPLFAALGGDKKSRAGSLRWKLVWVVIAVVALTLLVVKQAY